MTLAALRGKTVVLTDFLTLCQEICPLTSANLAAVQKSLTSGGVEKNIVLVEVTVDPVRDTPQRLAAYRKIVGAGPNWLLLTADADTIASLWKWFGVAYQTSAEAGSPAPTDWWTGQPLTFDVGHNDAVFFLDSKGVERYLLTGTPNADGAPVAKPLVGFLNDEGRTNLASPGLNAWTATDVERTLSWLTGSEIS